MSGGAAAIAGLERERVALLLGSRGRAQLRLARRLRECRGLSAEQIEDIYQETVNELLARGHASEQHLIGELHAGIRTRARHERRDTRRRLAILHEHARALDACAQAREQEQDPARAAAGKETRRAVLGFLALLDQFERELFWLDAIEGLKYRAAASRLGVDEQAVRRASRRVEAKRARYAWVLQERGERWAG